METKKIIEVIRIDSEAESKIYELIEQVRQSQDQRLSDILWELDKIAEMYEDSF